MSTNPINKSFSMNRASKTQHPWENHKIEKRLLTDKQYRAIRLAANVGEDICRNYQEIVTEYRSGSTAPMLVAGHKFDQRYGVSPQIATCAVRNALCGYSGHLYAQYAGLIADRSEQKSLALDHNKQTGIEAAHQKRGIHALNHAQKVDASRKGGLIGGPRTHLLRVGCHALPPEVLREHLRKISPLGRAVSGRASVLAKGLVPYTPATPEKIAEIEFVCRLAADPHYLGPVRSNFKKIAELVNEAFYMSSPRYTRTSLKIALQSYRRHNLSTTDPVRSHELSFAEKLTHDPAFQIPARIKAAEIARKVNEDYHNGIQVRNSCTIGDAIRRYRQISKVQRIGR
jgi:hypothetical protein